MKEEIREILETELFAENADDRVCGIESATDKIAALIEKRSGEELIEFIKWSKVNIYKIVLQTPEHSIYLFRNRNNANNS